MDLRHLPEGTHSLAVRPGSLARLAFQNGAGVRGGELAVKPPASLSPDQNHERPIPVQAKIGPRGRICTCNLPGLGGTPLLIGLHAVDAHGRTRTDTVRVLSALSLRWTTWARLVPREGFPPPTSPS